MGVLLVRTSSLGGVIHTLPALTSTARTIPGIQFDWVMEEGFAEIPAWRPVVTRVIPMAIRRWRKNLWQTLRNGEWQRFKQHLKEVDHDLVIDTQGLLKSAWLTRYMGKAPVADLSRDSAHEPLANHFYHCVYPIAWGQHAVEHIRQLFARALDYPLPESVGDYGLNHEQLANADLGAPYLVFLHDTTWITKHWPEAYRRELAECVCERGWSVRLPWGNTAERERAGYLAAGLENAAILLRLSLAGMAEALADARTCVAVDTGLDHLAVALDAPTLSLFGLTNPGFIGACGRSQVYLGSDFPCAPCLKKICTYQPAEEDRKLFGLKHERLLCFTRLNPQRVTTQLEAVLLAPETLR